MIFRRSRPPRDAMRPAATMPHLPEPQPFPGHVPMSGPVDQRFDPCGAPPLPAKNPGDRK